MPKKYNRSTWRTVRLSNPIPELNEPNLRNKAFRVIKRGFAFYDCLSGGRQWETQACRSWKRYRKTQHRSNSW